MRSHQRTACSPSATQQDRLGLQGAASWARILGVRGQRPTHVTIAPGLNVAHSATQQDTQQDTQDKSLHGQHQQVLRADASLESGGIPHKGHSTWYSTPGIQHQASSLFASILRLPGGAPDVQDFLAALILSECAYKKVEMGHVQVARKVSLYMSQFEGLVQLDSIQLTLDDVPQHYIVCTSADALYVAFMGTKQARDLITDATALHQPVWAESLALAADNQSTPAAHSGFLQRARAVDIEQLYALAQAQGKRLVLCGHSLGGAVAKLATLRLLRELPEWPAPRLRCICFATPAVGNAALARLVESAGWDQYFNSFCLPEDPLMRALMRFHQVGSPGTLTPSSLSTSSREPSPAPTTADLVEGDKGTSQAGSDAAKLAIMPSGIAEGDQARPAPVGRAGSLSAMGSWAKTALDATVGRWYGTSTMQRAVSTPPPPATSAEAEALSDKEAAAVEEILSASPKPNLSGHDVARLSAAQHCGDASSSSLQQASMSQPEKPVFPASTAAGASGVHNITTQQAPAQNLALSWALQRSRVTRQLQRFVPQLSWVLPGPSFHMFGSHLYIGANAVWPMASPPPPGAVLASNGSSPASTGPASNQAQVQGTVQTATDVAAEAVVGMADAVAVAATKSEVGSGLLATAASIVQAWSPAVPLPRSPFAMHSMKAHRRRARSLVQLCKRAAQVLHEQGMLGLLHHGDLATGASLNSFDQESLSSVDVLATLAQQVPGTAAQPLIGVHQPSTAGLEQQTDVEVRTDLVPHMKAVRAVARVPLPGLRRLQRVAPGTAGPAADTAAVNTSQGQAAGSGDRQMELLVMVDGKRLQYSRSVTASWLPAGGTAMKPLPVRVLYTRVHAQDNEAAQGSSAANKTARRPAVEAARQRWQAVQASVRNALQFLGRSLSHLGLSGPHDQAEDMCSVAVAISVPEDAMAQVCAPALQAQDPQPPATGTSQSSLSGTASQAQLHLVFKSDFQHEAIQVTMLPWRVALLATSYKTRQLLQAAMAVAARTPRAAVRNPVQLLRVLRSRTWVPWPRRQAVKYSPAASIANVPSDQQPAAVLAATAGPLVPADDTPQPWSRGLQAAALVAATVAATAADVPGSQAVSQAADLLLHRDLPTTAALLSVTMAAGLSGLPATKAALLDAASGPVSSAAALSNTLMNKFSNNSAVAGTLPVLPQAPPLVTKTVTAEPVSTFRFTDWIDPWVPSTAGAASKQAPETIDTSNVTVGDAVEASSGRQPGSTIKTAAHPVRRPFGRWINRMAAQAPFQAGASRPAGSTSQQPFLLNGGILLEECTRATWARTPVSGAYRGVPLAQAVQQRAAGWLPTSLQQVGCVLTAWLQHVPTIHLPPMFRGQHAAAAPRRPAAGCLTQQLTAPAVLLVAASLQDQEMRVLARSRRVSAGTRAAKAAGVKVLPVLLVPTDATPQQQQEACKAMAAACGVEPQEVYMIDASLLAGLPGGDITSVIATEGAGQPTQGAGSAVDGLKGLRAALWSVLQQQHRDLLVGPEGAAEGTQDGGAQGNASRGIIAARAIRSKL